MAASSGQPQYGVVIDRKWIWRAIVFSLLAHALFFGFARFTPLKKFGDAYFERIVPRTFRVERVEIDPRALLKARETEPELAPHTPEVKRVELPKEKQSFTDLMKEVRVQPGAPAQPIPLPEEKPELPPESLEKALKSAAGSKAPEADSELAALRDQLLDRTGSVKGKPLLELPAAKAGGGTDAETSGFTNLDALLAKSGPVPEGQAIAMDAGLLFDYDSAELREIARADLEKLAALIARTPRAYLTIEGHADTFGADDYNFALSRRRAEAVRDWLVANKGMSPERVRTVGYGKTRLRVPGGSIEEQQLNRRVEILISSRPFSP